jgi:hypothetical protein
MPAALDRLLRRLDPDPTPTVGPEGTLGHHPTTVIENDPPGYTNPNQPPPTNPDCICRNLDGIGQNPTCTVHPWWRHDDDALDLADLTRELGSALAAARQKFGDGA